MFLSVAEVSHELGVSRQQVWRLIRSGRLPGRRVGRAYVVSRVNLERMVAARAGVEAARKHPMVRRAER